MHQINSITRVIEVKMMEDDKKLQIEQVKQGNVLTCKLLGWLDPNTSPDLVSEINLTDVSTLILDMANVEYVFSSGIRAFLMLQKILEKNGGKIRVINVAENIRNIFEYAGLESMLD